MKIGIIGAGFVGKTLATQAVANNHDVMISNSRGKETLFSHGHLLRCKTGTAKEAAAFGDVVILAVPMFAYDKLPAQELAGKTVIDACNYYPERDGYIAPLQLKLKTSSELISKAIDNLKVVKAFNCIVMTDIPTDSHPKGEANRRALPFSGNDEEARQLVAGLVDEFGFDAVDTGPLSESWRFEPDTPVYCVPMTRDKLKATLASTER